MARQGGFAQPRPSHRRRRGSGRSAVPHIPRQGLAVAIGRLSGSAPRPAFPPGPAGTARERCAS